MKLRLWPRSLVGQLLFAVAVTLFVAQAINLALLARGQRQQVLAHGGGMAVARIIDANDRLEHGVAEISTASTPRAGRGPRVAITTAAPQTPPRAVAFPELADYVTELLADAEVPSQRVQAWALPQRVGPNARRQRGGGRTALIVAEIDGHYYAVRGRIPTDGSRLKGFLIWQTLSLYVLLLVPILLIAWRAAAPLRALTHAARAAPPTREVEPLLESGPSDVRELTGAFNLYRARIVAMLSDKDRMLGAVGHDLRTPLASLRVRVEQVDDDGLRIKMIASIDEMAAMLTDILALARSGAGTEAAERVDVGQLIAELVRDYGERGKPVTSGDVADAVVVARPMLLRRALRNLVDNAVSYGGAARLSVAVVDGMAQVTVADEGPGLSDAQIASLMEPFARGEQSRNRATGGAGLGLSIAREIAEAEGGSLALANRADGNGLNAMMSVRLA